MYPWENRIDLAAVSKASNIKSLKPWQQYLLSCFPREKYVDVEDQHKHKHGMWRHATWEAFVSDTIACNGTQMATILSIVYKPKIIVEFGLDAGLTTLQFCKLNPEAKVYGIDINSINVNTGLPICIHAIRNNPSNLEIVIKPSWEFELEGKVNLCFIDGDHIGDSPYRDSIRAWKNRNISEDWCIAWDDYHVNNPDVYNAVNRFVDEVNMELHQIGSWFYIGTVPHKEVQCLQ